jgi:hypothetical protein
MPYVLSWQGFVFGLVLIIIHAILDQKAKYFQVLWICYIVTKQSSLTLKLQSCLSISKEILVADSFEL